ncbi:MAG: hypothetical protein U0003_03465 [Vampirovibrionales bacterium]
MSGTHLDLNAGNINTTMPAGAPGLWQSASNAYHSPYQDVYTPQLGGGYPPAPQGFLGRLWSRFERVNSWVWTPSMIGMLSLVGLGGLKNGVPRIQQASFLTKPLHWVVDKAHHLNNQLTPWGQKVSHFVLHTCGLENMLKNNAIGGKSLWTRLYNLTSKGIGWSSLAENKWYSGIARFFKGAGAFNGTGVAAGSLAQTGLRFSLRSVMTAIGYAGPIGWVTLGITAGLTLLSGLKRLLSPSAPPVAYAQAPPVNGNAAFVPSYTNNLA